MNFVICTEAMDVKQRFSGTLADVRTAAQSFANAQNRTAKIVYADNPPNTNPLVQAGVDPQDVRVERFTPAGISPTVNTLTPATGPAAGGTTVVVSGTRFDQGLTNVTLGGNAVTSLKRIDDETFSFVAPAHAAGAVPLVVTNPDATTVAKANAFTYA